MSYRDSMIIINISEGYSIGLVNDSLYNPDSADNVVSYGQFYANKPFPEYYLLQAWHLPS